MSSDTQTLPRAATRLPPAAPLRARLVFVHPPALAGAFPLPASGGASLGRAASGAGTDLTLADGTISRQHAVFSAAADTHRLADAGSRNGTALNGVPLPPGGPPRALADQDVLRFGDVLAVYESGRGVALAADDRDPAEVSRQAAPGVSAAAVELRWHLSRAAPDLSPCLITGETGTGKELLAAELHRLSGRKGPVVTLNCAALSPQLVESQLFGHARGAFTGAVAPQPGLFRAAEGGTLFLDEIGELPLDLQPKLLRALQEREVHPVGETRPVRVNVRVVAATHRDLADLVERGLFRRDLYARLVLWQVGVPALRARRADVPGWLALLDARWRTERPRTPATPLSLDADTAERLLLDAWPENLRGLDRLVHRLAGDGGGLVTLARLAQLGVPLSDHAASAAGPALSDEAESARPAPPDAETLAALLAECGGSVRGVARRLGRDRKQVYRWLERFGLRAAPEPGDD